MGLLLRRRVRSLWNSVRSWTGYEWARNAAFAAVGFALLSGLHNGFVKVLSAIDGVPLIGRLLVWKLSAMLLMMTMSMIVVSGLLTAMTTLFYSYDLRFLMKAPVSLRVVFLDKSLESAFFASWTIGLMLAPFALALKRVLGAGWPFVLAFAVGIPPYLLLAASVGIAFTLVLLKLFPTSRTRDVVWMLSSLSLTVAYGLVRFAQPEKLVRPDAIGVVAEYLRYLQAPTAPYVPSWWLAESARAAAAGRWGDWALRCGALWAAAVLVYGGLVALAGRIYFDGYSGAQEGALRRRTHDLAARLFESRLARARESAALLWKERVLFSRDVRHWSQLTLIIGLVFVYLFSIRRLPLDTPEIRSLISFLNVGTAGFVLAALGLRFTFPSISAEGRSWWVIRAAPVDLDALMRQKLKFSALPIGSVALILGVMTNRILGADAFTGALSLAALLGTAFAVCAMGVGFGAIFPRFDLDNIHQVESSLGGFVYMAACLFYVGGTVAALAGPMQMHFMQKIGTGTWNWGLAGLSLGGWALLNAAVAIPWVLGRRALESHE